MIPPLVKGGQGRSAAEVRDTAKVLAWLFLVGVVLLLVLAVTS